MPPGTRRSRSSPSPSRKSRRVAGPSESQLVTAWHDRIGRRARGDARRDACCVQRHQEVRRRTGIRGRRRDLGERAFAGMTKGETTAKAAKPDAKPRADKVAEVQEVKPPPRIQSATFRRRPPRPEALPMPPERPRDLQAEAKAAEEKAAEEQAAAAAKAAETKAAEVKAADAKARAEARAKADAEARLADEKAEAKLWPRPKPRPRPARPRRSRSRNFGKPRRRQTRWLAPKPRQRPSGSTCRSRGAEEGSGSPRQGRGGQKLAALAAEPPKPVQPKPQPRTDTKFDPSQSRSCSPPRRSRSRRPRPARRSTAPPPSARRTRRGRSSA